MDVTRHPLFTSGKQFVALVRAEQLSFLAAAISYYAFVSVVPLLIVGLAVTTAVSGPALTTQVVAAVGEFLTPEATTLLETALEADAGRGGVTTVGLAVLVWGGLRVFRGLDVAFSLVYGTTTPKPLLSQIRDALLVLSAVGLAIIGTIAGTTAVGFDLVPLSGLTGTATLAVFLPVLFLPLYYVFPSERVTVREAVPGAVVAGVGWALLGSVFGIYASYAGSFQLYGVLGGVLLVLVWFYFAGLLLLVGAAVNVVAAGRVDDGQLAPVSDRQLQQGALRGFDQRATMSDTEGPTDDESPPGESPGGDDAAGDSGSQGPDRDQTRRADVVTKDDLDDLRQEIDDFEDEIEGRTVHRDELERELKGYVRSRVRRGHARGWGPYLVLLYGTVMTLGAFASLSGIWAILAMLVIWLSTLGLYTLMVLVGLTSTALGLPGRVIGRLRNLR